MCALYSIKGLHTPDFIKVLQYASISSLITCSMFTASTSGCWCIQPEEEKNQSTVAGNLQVRKRGKNVPKKKDTVTLILFCMSGGSCSLANSFIKRMTARLLLRRDDLLWAYCCAVCRLKSLFRLIHFIYVFLSVVVWNLQILNGKSVRKWALILHASYGWKQIPSTLARFCLFMRHYRV